MRKIVPSLLAACCCLTLSSYSQALVGWTFNTSGTHKTATTSSASLASAPVISVGSGVTDNGAQNVGSCSGTLTLETTNYTATFDATRFIQFTLTPAAASSVNLDNLVLNLRVVGTGPRSWSIRSSEDNYTTDLDFGNDEISASGCTNITMQAGISSSDPISLRIYFYNAGNGTGRLNIDEITGNGFGQLLPVTLLNFNANRNGSANKLIWQVAEERNFSHYVVERSSDARNYTAIGRVNAANLKEYTFTDSKPGAVNYYRLVLADRNGTTSRGKVVSVVNQSNGVAAQLLPNVVSTTTNLALSLAQAGAVNLLISDMNGRQVMRTRVNMNTPSQNIPLNLSSLAAGTYQLTIETESGKRQNLRFVKQ